MFVGEGLGKVLRVDDIGGTGGATPVDGGIAGIPFDALPVVDIDSAGALVGIFGDVDFVAGKGTVRLSLAGAAHGTSGVEETLHDGDFEGVDEIGSGVADAPLIGPGREKGDGAGEGGCGEQE